MNIQIKQIRLDGGTQPRAQINLFTVSEYAEEMRLGAKFPDVVLFFDGSDYWLADGFHRVRAAIEIKLDTINAEVRQGTRRDAVLFSVGANANHGMRRTNEDKRRAVETLLNDEEWRRWSDGKIAKQCGVSGEMVRGLRGAIFQTLEDSPRLVERNGRTYEMNTAHIGKTAVEIEDNIEWEEEDTPEREYAYAYEQARNAQAAGFDVVLPDPPIKPHVAHNSGNNEWYTPKAYIDAAFEVMGGIDLDPASSAIANEIIKATTYHTSEDDGLSKNWAGHVWMNPPYSSELISKFTSKLCEHFNAGEIIEAIVLVNNATETGWFQEMAELASAICFPKGRVKFWHPERESAAPLQGQAVLYLGKQAKKFSAAFADFGFTVSL